MKPSRRPSAIFWKTAFGRGTVTLSGLLMSFGLLSTLPAQDVVIFKNGDRLTGRIKNLERGVLVLDAPVLDGDAKLDWKRIEAVESARFFQFQTTAGRRFLGRIATADPETSEEEISILVDESKQTFRHDEIVSMTQTVAGLSGFLVVKMGGGLALTKSNARKQFTAEASASYDTTGYSTNGFLNSIFTTQAGSSNTNRHNVRLTFIKKLPRRWGVGVLSDFLNSDEQQLELRTIFGGVLTRDFIRTNSVVLRAIGGAAWNNERYREEVGFSPDSNGLEGLGGIEVSFFQFREWNVDSTLLTYPSISNAGRVRMDWNVNLRFRLIHGRKLWWNLNQTVNLDSKPPASASGTDYVTTTSVSWEFP